MSLQIHLAPASKVRAKASSNTHVSSTYFCCLRLLPGKTFKATVTPAGNVPVYKANGMQAYFASLFLFFLLQQYGPAYGLRVSWVYHHMGELLSAMNVFSLAFCFFLLVKGVTFPSSSDSGSSGNWIIDFYWYVLAKRERGVASIDLFGVLFLFLFTYEISNY